MNIEKLWLYVCSGDIEELEKYYDGKNEINKRYVKFGIEHSLIMGALRNNQFEVVKFLKLHGETITEKEQEEINCEM